MNLNQRRVEDIKGVIRSPSMVDKKKIVHKHYCEEETNDPLAIILGEKNKETNKTKKQWSTYTA